MARTKKQPQSQMDETLVDNPELEQLLDQREELKPSRTEFNKLSKAITEKLKAIEAASPFRIGRFSITRNMIDGRSVSFETSGGVRFGIKLAGEE